MAAKVGLLDHHQDISGVPAQSIKRSRADILVRRLLAERITKYLYRMLPVNDTPIRAVECTPQPRTFIPEDMPANIDAMLGVIDQSPVLSEQIRFRHV